VVYQKKESKEDAVCQKLETINDPTIIPDSEAIEQSIPEIEIPVIHE